MDSQAPSPIHGVLADRVDGEPPAILGLTTSELLMVALITGLVLLPLLLAIMASLTAMRLWAEERKIGSVELLFTLPVTITQAVLGKFFAAWLFLGIALALTFPMV